MKSSGTSSYTSVTLPTLMSPPKDYLGREYLLDGSTNSSGRVLLLDREEGSQSGAYGKLERRKGTHFWSVRESRPAPSYVTRALRWCPRLPSYANPKTMRQRAVLAGDRGLVSFAQW